MVKCVIVSQFLYSCYIIYSAGYQVMWVVMKKQMKLLNLHWTNQSFEFLSHIQISNLLSTNLLDLKSISSKLGTHTK